MTDLYEGRPSRPVSTWWRSADGDEALRVHPEIVGEIIGALRGGVDEASAERIARASEPLWRALERHGLVDGFGGSEWSNALPLAVAEIYRYANDPPLEESFSALLDDMPPNYMHGFSPSERWGED